MIRKPNLFILGAPKCGTTSLANWLNEHPEILISDIKEPHYYNKDLNHNTVKNLEQYLSLFKNAKETHKRIGEASVWYLFSQVAIDNILKDFKNKDLRFIVMLRNPVKMAQSLHEQQVFNMNEPEKDFEKAWHLQPQRVKNKKTALTTRDPKLLLYGETCLLGKQVERLLEKVERQQVKFILLDDIIKEPTFVYSEVLNFLDVSEYKKVKFKAFNGPKARRYPWLAVIIKIIGKLKQKLNIRKGFGIMNLTNSLNKKDKKRKTINSDFELKLKDFFKEDIILLSKLIDRDLKHWIND